MGTIDISEIFLEYFAVYDAIVNQLFSTKLISLNLKKDVESYLWFLFKAEPGVKRHWSYEMSTRKWGILSCNTIIILYN